ncbi:MAG TPA: DUF3147 family protein [Polyangia bacterium]|nr:DUF3147 family protein [Polyangia bacterium]
MRLRFDFAPLQQTHWYGHVLRFVAGGLTTAATGLVAKAFGPVVGGLFLAFPSIFPLGLGMLERRHREQVGGAARGDRARRAGIVEAAGAAVGSVGIIAFALVARATLGRAATALALGAALAAWALVAFATWVIRKSARRLGPSPPARGVSASR